MIKLLEWLLYTIVYGVCIILIGFLALVTWDDPVDVLDKLMEYFS